MIHSALPALALLVATWAGTAPAQEYVETSGPLTDDVFYNAVACGAPPGGTCAKPMVRWDRKAPIRVSIRRMDPAYLGGKRLRAMAAVERAIQEINRADAGVRLVEVARDATAEIDIYFPDIAMGEPIEGTGIDGVDGTPLGGASVRMLSHPETGAILRVVIIFSTTMEIRAYESAMLEEITQGLGLMTDIKNPYYDDKSIFSQDSNARTTLGTQDIMALTRHYQRDTIR